MEPHDTLTDAPAPRPRWGMWLGLALGVFALTFATLAWNAAPGVSFHDSGEFSLAARCAGIPHPPGAPTWGILASLFVRAGRFADAARGANCFSAFCGAATLALIALLAQLWVFLITPTRPSALAEVAAGLVAPLALLHSPAFLEQCFVAEQYTLLTALIGLALVPPTLLHRAFFRNNNPQSAIRNPQLKAVSGAGGDARAPGGHLLCLLTGLVAGWAIGNHPSQIVLGALLAWTVWFAAGHGGRPRRLADLATLAGAAALGLLLGLLVFLWLPIRSHANPVLDWGNIKTWDRFLWAVRRGQWESRPFSEAPPGFVRQWFGTYQPALNLGWAGVALALAGAVALLRRGRMLLGWLASIVIPYGAGLLLGHMHQFGIGSEYIRLYGIIDWHLPLYQGGALLAGVGAGAASCWLIRRRGARVGGVAIAALLLALALTAGRAVSAASLRGFTAPAEFVRAMLAPLPEDALVLAHRDNTSHMLAYAAYGAGTPSTRCVAYCMSDPVQLLQPGAHPGPAWSPELKAWLWAYVMQPNVQPLRLKPLAPEEVRRRPLYLDAGMTSPELCQFMKPAGMFYEMCDRPVTNAEVLEADRAWRARHPEALKRAVAGAHRLERSAWGALLAGRGVYLTNRGLWAEAAEAYVQSLAWFPESPAVHFSHGYALSRMGRPAEAMAEYRAALGLEPALADARTNLALLLGEAGRWGEAEALLREGAARYPRDSRQFGETLAQVNRARRAAAH